MSWHSDSITPGEIEALQIAAEQSWGEDTRYPLARSGGDSGQCYVTACWLRSRLGGYVGRQGGHYAWLSPGLNWVLDLASHTGETKFHPNKGYVAVLDEQPPRADKFIKRANKIFDNLATLLRVSDMTGDGLPAQEPQREENNEQEHFLNMDGPYWHDEPDFEPAQGEYKFVYGNGQLEVSPSHKHDELAEHAGIRDTHTGPMAMGYVVVTNNKATWEVDSNINVKALARTFKEYTKHVGWDWGGITHIDGEPISDDFAPKKSHLLNWAYAEEHLYIGGVSSGSVMLQAFTASKKADGVPLFGGRVLIAGRQAFVTPIVPDAIPALSDWADDEGLILYSWNDNVLKKIPDLEQFNFGDPNPTQPDDHQFPVGPKDEREPSGVYKCPNCERLFPGWYEYQKHRKEEGDSYGEEPVEDGKFPESDTDSTFPTHFTEQQPFIMPMGRREAARVDGFSGDGGEYFVAYRDGSPIGYARVKNGKLDAIHEAVPGVRNALYAKVVKYTEKEPKDLLEGPLPFLYDVKNDYVTVGQPGQRTSDIPGKFTPGGIVEGVYEPGGKVVLRSVTSMPFTVRHLVQLWYYQHPELSVSSVHLQDDQGGNTKLAADDDIGGYIQGLVASNPAASNAAEALRAAGGNVYVVGGAVRDAVMGKEPKDLDLMVQGLEPADVQAVLRGQPGHVDVTGRNFGVFRYRHNGEDVEIALPRKERSTGAGHRDFEVHADPHLTPQEDFHRRDFSANAMGVDLANGQLIDPYGGVKDIRNSVLRAHNPESLKEDPLRVLRGIVLNGRYGLVPDAATRQQMGENAGSLEHLDAERVQAELDKLFASDQPAQAIRLAQETGVLQHVLPEVSSAFGFDQNNPHHELELGDHLVKVLERTAERTKDPDVRLAALLHDIGKPASAWVDPERGTNHYYKKIMDDGSILGANHEDVGAEMARNLMTRLRYPTARTNRVAELVQHHMWAPFTTDRGARRFLNRVGPHADDLFDIRWGDQGGKAEYPGLDPDDVNLNMQKDLMDRVRNSGQATERSQLAVNGNDLINAGIPQGPQIGTILQQLTQAVIDNPDLNQRDQLLTMARDYATL